MNDVFKALADPTRREILLMIAEQPCSVNTISDQFNISRPAISKHIKILKDCKLVSMQTDGFDGRQRNCFAQLEALKEVENYLQQLEKFWSTRLDRLGQFLEEDENNQ